LAGIKQPQSLNYHKPI